VGISAKASCKLGLIFNQYGLNLRAKVFAIIFITEELLPKVKLCFCTTNRLDFHVKCSFLPCKTKFEYKKEKMSGGGGGGEQPK
jgi:hypothetical protein